MPSALSPAVELRLRLANRPDDNAAAIVSDRGMYLGYVSAERALLICKRMKESQTVAVFQAMHGSGADIRIRFVGGVPTQPGPRCSETPATPPAWPADRPVYDSPARTIRMRIGPVSGAEFIR